MICESPTFETVYNQIGLYTKSKYTIIGAEIKGARGGYPVLYIGFKDSEKNLTFCERYKIYSQGWATVLSPNMKILGVELEENADYPDRYDYTVSTIIPTINLNSFVVEAVAKTYKDKKTGEDKYSFWIQQKLSNEEKEKTRLELRAEVLPDYNGGEVGILDVCQSLHSSVIGSSELLLKDIARQEIKFLEKCLETWDKSICEFDFAVKSLIIAALGESKKFYKDIYKEGDF